MSEIYRLKRLIDAECREERVKSSLDSYIDLVTYYKSWDEYKQFLLSNYLVDETPEKSTQHFINTHTYSSYEELWKVRRSKKLIVDYFRGVHKGNYFVVSGDVKNNTNKLVKFVVVKIELRDKNGKVFDSDTTYAVGEEGILPGNSAKFECYLDYDSRLEDYSASIFRYE